MWDWVGLILGLTCKFSITNYIIYKISNVLVSVYLFENIHRI